MKRRLKSYVPGPVWRLLRRSYNYLQRIRVWVAVLEQMKGSTAADRKTLSRSARAGVLNSLRNLDDWQDPDLLGDIRVHVRNFGHFSIRAHTDDLYHVLPAREAMVVRAIRRRLGPAMTFVDAGANIGFFTILGSRLVGPWGRVIAVEMMPDTADILRQHIALNEVSNVALIEHALSERSGMTIQATVPEGKFGQATIMAASGPTDRQVSVVSRTLDDVLADVPGTIDVMKMDLEGAELPALLGGHGSLPRIKAIIFEQLGGKTDVSDFLVDRGYSLTRLDENNILAERPAENPSR
jgi:FkbM family methyltransferase